MKACLQHDPARGAGHGIIRIQDFNGTDTELAFSLRRASDGKYLGSQDWLDAEQRLQADMVQIQRNELCLLVGPALVDMLDTLDNFAICLYAPGAEAARCALELGDIVFSSLNGGSGMARAVPPPPPPPAPESLPEPELEPQAEMADNDELPPLRDPDVEKSRLPLVLLLLVLLLAAGAGLYWYFAINKPAEPAAQNTSEAASAPPPVPASPATETQPEKTENSDKPEAADSAPVLSSLQRAREHLRGSALPEQSLKLAQDLHTPEAADAAFLLLEDAAQKGNAEAMLELGRFYDPVDGAPKGSISPDAQQAYTWYVRAEAQGHGGARERLEALRAWMEANKAAEPQK